MFKIKFNVKLCNYGLNIKKRSKSSVGENILFVAVWYSGSDILYDVLSARVGTSEPSFKDDMIHLELRFPQFQGHTSFHVLHQLVRQI